VEVVPEVEKRHGLYVLVVTDERLALLECSAPSNEFQNYRDLCEAVIARFEPFLE
jgi:hypothetical protein